MKRDGGRCSSSAPGSGRRPCRDGLQGAAVPVRRRRAGARRDLRPGRGKRSGAGFRPGGRRGPADAGLGPRPIGGTSAYARDVPGGCGARGRGPARRSAGPRLPRAVAGRGSRRSCSTCVTSWPWSTGSPTVRSEPRARPPGPKCLALEAFAGQSFIIPHGRFRWRRCRAPLRRPVRTRVRARRRVPAAGGDRRSGRESAAHAQAGAAGRGAWSRGRRLPRTQPERLLTRRPVPPVGVARRLAGGTARTRRGLERHADGADRRPAAGGRRRRVQRRGGHTRWGDRRDRAEDLPAELPRVLREALLRGRRIAPLRGRVPGRRGCPVRRGSAV